VFWVEEEGEKVNRMNYLGYMHAVFGLFSLNVSKTNERFVIETRVRCKKFGGGPHLIALQMLSLSGGPFGSSLVCGCALQLAALLYPIPPADSTLALCVPRVLARSLSPSRSHSPTLRSLRLLQNKGDFAVSVTA
jgi:hypothetical protein